MPQLHVGDRVRLVNDILRSSPHRGLVGEIKSLWFASPTSAFYEVEFAAPGSNDRTRQFLRGEQLEVQTDVGAGEWHLSGEWHPPQ
jgi:hypothetical protein